MYVFKESELEQVSEQREVSNIQADGYNQHTEKPRAQP
jgi:hypothetical protein